MTVFKDFMKIKLIKHANNAHGNVQNVKILQIIVMLVLETEYQPNVIVQIVPLKILKILSLVQIVTGNVYLVNLTKINVVNAEVIVLIHQIVSAQMVLMNQI